MFDDSVLGLHHSAIERLFQDFIDLGNSKWFTLFKTTCEQATWPEIADVRDRVNNAERTPIIFTTGFFRAGIRTLANTIASYLSQDQSTTDLAFQSAHLPATTFELVLDGNDLS